MPELRVARSELVLGTPDGGQLARALALAEAWLALAGEHEAVYVATAQAWDGAMRERVSRHRRSASGEPRLRTAEEPLALAHALGASSRPGTLVVVDCLTLWLTALMMGSAQQGGPGFAGHLPMPTEGEGSHPPAILADAIATCAGPLVLLGHARGGPLLPGRDARQFADTLGRLDQQAAAACERVTLMSGGLAMVLKEAA